MTSHPVTDSYVYFARCGQYVKIGFSCTPQRRMRALASDVRCGRGIQPSDLDRRAGVALVHLVHGCRMRDERVMHGLFDRYRVSGEWFRYSPGFQRQLAAMRYQTCRQRDLAFRAARRSIKRRLATTP